MQSWQLQSAKVTPQSPCVVHRMGNVFLEAWAAPTATPTPLPAPSRSLLGSSCGGKVAEGIPEPLSSVLFPSPFASLHLPSPSYLNPRCKIFQLLL